MIPRIPAIYTTLKIFFQLLCFFIGRGKSLNSSQTKISWEPLEPLLFNEDVILKCSIKDCCPDGTQWTGGKTNSLLTLGRVSNNKAKYEETWGVDASYLKIKNFGIDDGDSLYTCFHGFNKDPPKNLTITGNKFALMPTEETLKKNVTVRNGYLNASVDFLKVYPKPVCNCTFQKLGIAENINVSSSFYPTASIFLNGKLDIGHQICNTDCLGTIQIDCRIGTHEFKVFEAIVDIQFIQSLLKTKDKEFCTIICFVISIVTVTLIMSVAVVVYVWYRRKGKDRCWCIKEMKWSVEETSEECVQCPEISSLENMCDDKKESEAESLLGEKHETADDSTEKTQRSTAMVSLNNKEDTNAGIDAYSKTNGSAGGI